MAIDLLTSSTDDILNGIDYSNIDTADTSSGSGMSASQGLGLLGDAMSIYGTLKQGSEAKKAYEYNAALVREQGVIEQYQLGKEEVATLSSARAMTAKAGVTQSGSPLDAALASASGFELDKQITRYNTESKANMLEWSGKMAQKQAKEKAGMQLLQTAGTMALMLA